MQLAVMIVSADPAEFHTLLRCASKSGYEAVQLWPRFPADEDDWRGIMTELNNLGLHLVAIGGYANALQPNAEASVAELRAAIERAPSIGCHTVVTWSGTRNAALFDDHPANESAETWDAAVAHFQDVAGWAESAGVSVAIEPFHNHVARTPERLRDLVDAVNSPRIGCVMDPPNFLKAWQIDEVNTRMPSMFEMLAGRIALVHAKDLRRPHPGETRRVIADVALPHPGDGIMDYALYGQLVQQHYRGPIVVEHITEETMGTARAYVAERMEVADG